MIINFQLYFKVQKNYFFAPSAIVYLKKMIKCAGKIKNLSESIIDNYPETLSKLLTQVGEFKIKKLGY